MSVRYRRNDPLPIQTRKSKMKTKSKRGAAARVDRRIPRNPTPRRLKVPLGKWKPRVKLTSKGPNRADMQRKVENTTIVRVPLDGVLADLVERLRSGEDVRFTLGGREALRVFPCLNADCTAMYPSAHAMGELRDCLADIEFEMVDKDKSPVEPETARAEKAERSERIRQSRETSRQGVVPKRVFKCWNCGAENEITGFGND